MYDLQEPLAAPAPQESSFGVLTFVREFGESSRKVLFSSKFNALMLFTPLALISWQADWSDAATLIFSLLSLMPMAERIGYVTESLAEYTGEYLGGLLNATMGNLPELIVCITALQSDDLRLIQLSLLGAIFGCLLLVLGHALLSGGMFFDEQTFNLKAAEPQFGILVLGGLSLLFPASLTQSDEQSKTDEINYSRGTAVVMIIEYGALLLFQMYTHNYLFAEGTSQDDDKPLDGEKERTVSAGAPSLAGFDMNDLEDRKEELANGHENGSAYSPMTREVNTTVVSLGKSGASDTGDDGGDDEDEEDPIPFWHAFLWLAILAAFIAVLSDALVEVFEEAAEELGVPEAFIAAIVLPIANNACEHACAVIFASRGQVDMALGTTVGSAVQIIMFVIPFTVIVAWMLDKDLTLYFQGFETSALFSTVLMVVLSIRTGTSTWITGFFLIGAYIIIAMGFFIASDIEFSDDDDERR
uniref:Sodium/calcium exchanger membrane region domain-containing protein n=1 Tax=Phaeomonas parva TaxID=124430 RepID=A0A7S1TQ08_9STRA|mmetsp:Transcript_12505/g.37577  ORF Transcript_12505/g.37577 Transcript_12505/m.37577 type:complete len:472 (+) Transcript_12505:63-1478(+)